jgi:hypothetical protein
VSLIAYIVVIKTCALLLGNFVSGERKRRNDIKDNIVAHFDSLQPAFSTFKEERMKFTVA